MQRGEVWWADLPVPHGSEPGFRRPVLIIQADRFNRSRIGTLIALTISSNTRLGNMPGNVSLRKGVAGLSRASVVNVTQVTTIERDLLIGRIGALPWAEMQEVDDGLRLVLSL